jgi:hypothetical protein
MDDGSPSRLTKYPDLVQAIGMLSIESSNLENALCFLLSSLLAIDFEVAQAIYFSPKGQMARMDMIRNVCALGAHTRHKKTISIIMERARKVFDRRHVLLHADWGEEREYEGDELLFKGPSYLDRPHGKTIRIEAQSINATIQSARKVRQDAFELASAMRAARRIAK